MKEYLGDAVYADIVRGMVKLTVEYGDPEHPTETIYLEPEVFTALVEYVNRMKTQPSKTK